MLQCFSYSLLLSMINIDNLRLLNFGTFNARALSVLNYFNSLDSFSEYLFGNDIYKGEYILDNFYILLHSQFTLFSIFIVYGYFIKRTYTQREFFALGLLINYSLYADVY